MNRRPPPSFLLAEVSGREQLTPRLVRVTLQGPELTRLEVAEPASSVRVLLPDPSRPHALEIPAWDGNRFVLPGGRRPILRTLTPRHHDSAAGVLQVDVVVHGDGAASGWAASSSVGSPAAVSGPARGYTIDPEATLLVLGGDETAIAAISQIIEAARGDVEIAVHLEAATPGARFTLPFHPGGRVHWYVGDRSAPGRVAADEMARVDLAPGARLWAAGEAAAMQSLRQRLFRDRGVPRAHATIRGYWKHGRSSLEDAEED